jgi:hypothetical protein
VFNDKVMLHYLARKAVFYVEPAEIFTIDDIIDALNDLNLEDFLQTLVDFFLEFASIWLASICRKLLYSVDSDFRKR